MTGRNRRRCYLPASRRLAGFLLVCVLLLSLLPMPVTAREKSGRYLDEYSPPAPDQKKAPWYFRRYAAAIIEFGEIPTGPAPTVTWVWAWAFSGPGLGTIDYGRWGKTLSYIKVLPEEPPAPELTHSTGMIAVPDTNNRLADILLVDQGLFATVPVTLPVGTVLGQVSGMTSILGTNLGVVVPLPVPTDPDQIAAGIGPRLAAKLEAVGLERYWNKLGDLYLWVETPTNRLLTGFHRMDYMAQLNRAPYRKHVLTLTRADLPAVVGTDINENYRFPATVPPNRAGTIWDPVTRSRPETTGFYRDATSWHPALANGLWWKIPGGVISVYVEPPDWAIRAEQETVTGSPGDPQELVFIVTNLGSYENTAPLTWRWQGERDRRPVPGYERVTLGPGESVTVPLMVTVPSAARSVEMFVNLPPSGETVSLAQIEQTWDNNQAATEMRPDTADLAAVIQQHVSLLFAGQEYTYTARVTNSNARSVPTQLVWRVNGREQVRKSVTVTGTLTDSYRFHMPYVATGTRFTVEVEVNPDRNQPLNEPRWDNNVSRSVVTAFRPDAGGPDPGLGPGYWE